VAGTGGGELLFLTSEKNNHLNKPFHGEREIADNESPIQGFGPKRKEKMGKGDLGKGGLSL